MTEDDVPDLNNYGVAEGWNTSQHDLLVQYRMSPEGCFKAELNGENIGFLMCVHWGDTLTFGGMLLVKKDLRGQGIGPALFKRHLAFAGNRNVGLTAVADRFEAYKRLGFTETSKWKIVPYDGEIDSSKIKAKELSKGLDIIPYEETFLRDIVNYDTTLNTVGSRARFIRLWLEKPSTMCYVARDNGRVIGYVVIQPAMHGYRIAPLYCDSPNIAVALLKKLIEALPEETPVVTFTAPDLNAAMTDLAKECDLKVSMAPLYRQFSKYDLSKINPEKIFGTIGCETCFI